MATARMRTIIFTPLASGAPMMPTAIPRKTEVVARAERGAVMCVGAVMGFKCIGAGVRLIAGLGNLWGDLQF